MVDASADYVGACSSAAASIAFFSMAASGFLLQETGASTGPVLGFDRELLACCVGIHHFRVHSPSTQITSCLPSPRPR